MLQTLQNSLTTFEPLIASQALPAAAELLRQIMLQQGQSLQLGFSKDWGLLTHYYHRDPADRPRGAMNCCAQRCYVANEYSPAPRSAIESGRVAPSDVHPSVDLVCVIVPSGPMRLAKNTPAATNVPRVLSGMHAGPRTTAVRFSSGHVEAAAPLLPFSARQLAQPSPLSGLSLAPGLTVRCVRDMHALVGSVGGHVGGSLLMVRYGLAPRGWPRGGPYAPGQAGRSAGPCLRWSWDVGAAGTLAANPQARS